MAQSSVERRAKQKAAPWIERLARFGYAAKGVVYGLLGILAIQAAFSLGGKTTGSQGALRAIAQQPFGQILLVIVGMGLVGYVIWRLIQALIDPEHSKSNGWDDWCRRLGYGISSVAYASLAFSAFQIALGSSNGSRSDSSTESMTAMIMRQPFGIWLVGTAGALLIGLGCYYCYRAFRVKFRSKLLIDDLSLGAKALLIQICRFGIAARGVVFWIMGGFLIRAALTADPDKAKSTGGVLTVIEQSPYGTWALGAMALGLVAYGVYMGTMARYRRISPPRA